MAVATGITAQDLATIIKMLRELERKIDAIDRKTSSIKSRV